MKGLLLTGIFACMFIGAAYSTGFLDIGKIGQLAMMFAPFACVVGLSTID